jgi:hypothetical protein
MPVYAGLTIRLQNFFTGINREAVMAIFVACGLLHATLVTFILYQALG